MGKLVAVFDKEGTRARASETVVSMLKTSEYACPEIYGIASSTTLSLGKTLDVLETWNIDSSSVVGYAFSRILTRDEPQPLRFKNASGVFEGRVYPSMTEVADSEVFAGSVQIGNVDAASAFVKRTEGDFVFIVAENDRLLVGRDAIGAVPLYYGENPSFGALASERKALWKIGIEKPASFPPGKIAIVDNQGFKFVAVKTVVASMPAESNQMTMHEASETLTMLLRKSIRHRISDLKECAVAFSGGLDSSIIAFLAKELMIDVHLVHVSLENQPEIEYTKQVAEELNLPLHSYTFAKESIQRVIPDVLRLIEKPDPVQASIGIPIYWTAEKTAKMNLGVMLAGQGADELFAGYKRYVDELKQHGLERANKAVLDDIRNIHEINLERDSAICGFHKVELRSPFASYQIAKFAIDLPLRLKIDFTRDTIRKLVLRRLARKLGLPDAVVDRPKKAIQYSTGVNKILEEISRKEGLSIGEYMERIFRMIFVGLISNKGGP